MTQSSESILDGEKQLSRVKVYLKLPVYEIEGSRRRLEQVVELEIRREEVERMKRELEHYSQLVCYTDGSSLGNPGFSGCGVAIFGLSHSTPPTQDSHQVTGQLSDLMKIDVPVI
jgi:hypothetical protein